MTELEKKAENYAKSEFPNDEFKQQIVIKSLLYGYEQGQEHGLLMHLNVIADDYKKENEELKKSIAEKNSEVEELKAKLSSVYNCLYCGCSNCNFENCTTKRS